MKYTVSTPKEYMDALPEDRRIIVSAIREVIKKNLPHGFAEVINYGMLGYVVPYSRYPAGYHADPRQPLPFINIASQKNHIAVYHMGLYQGELLDWFLEQWRLTGKRKPDMGKSCIRFRKAGDVPLELLGKLAARLTPAEWIALYESRFVHK
jgi:hypothetical protein